MDQRKQVYAIVVVTAICCIAGVTLAWYFFGAAQGQPLRAGPTASSPASAALTSTPIVTETPTSQPSPRVNITVENASALVMEDYPMYYSIAAVNLTSQSYGKLLYEFTLVPKNGAPFFLNQTAWVDAVTGDLYTPAQEKAGITIDDAKVRARSAFPLLAVDRVRMKYNDGTRYDRSWEFRLYAGDTELVHGALSPDDGVLDWYAMNGPTRFGRPAEPVVSMNAVETTARAEIQDRTGNSRLGLVQSRYDDLGMPDSGVAGQYVFLYSNDRAGKPACENDGFTVVVDSVSGKVQEYRRTWTKPPTNAC